MAPAVTGQTVEWLVWTAITARSGGALHCYLPLRDLGVDAMVRHRASGKSIAVQVKGRTRLEEKILRIHVQTEEADVPGAVLIAVVADEQTLTLQQPFFVIPMTDVKQLGALVPYGQRQAYAVEIPFPPQGKTHWQKFACSIDELPQRLIPAAVTWGMEVGEVDEPRLGATGYMGEMALLQHLAGSSLLSVFHAFPDTEFVEYLVLRVDTGAYCGVQVKCIEIDSATQAGQVHISQRTFSQHAGEVVVIFIRIDEAVSAEAFVVPAVDIPGLASAHDDRFDLEVNPADPGQLAQYQIATGDLRARMEGWLAGEQTLPARRT